MRNSRENGIHPRCAMQHILKIKTHLCPQEDCTGSCKTLLQYRHLYRFCKFTATYSITLRPEYIFSTDFTFTFDLQRLQTENGIETESASVSNYIGKTPVVRSHSWHSGNNWMLTTQYRKADNWKTALEESSTSQKIIKIKTWLRGWGE